MCYAESNTVHVAQFRTPPYYGDCYHALFFEKVSDNLEKRYI